MCGLANMGVPPRCAKAYRGGCTELISREHAMLNRLSRLLRSASGSRTSRRRPRGRGSQGGLGDITRLVRRFMR